MVNRILVVLVPLTAILASTACDPGDCTLQLVSHTIEVVDASGNPLDDVEIEVVHIRTGTVLDVSDPEVAAPGEYVVVTSNHVQNGLVANGDEIEVTGAKNGASFTERYVVRTDAGTCHPTALEGATAIQLEL